MGTAYLAGFEKALADGVQVVLTMDADFSHDPSFIPSLIDGLEPGIDLVIGSRYVAGGGVRNWPLRRRLLSKGANLFAGAVLQLDSNDNTSGFRCYGRRLAEHMLNDPPKADGYSFLIEAVAVSQRKGFCIRERPITFIDRQLGTTKVSRQEILKALCTVLRLRFVKKKTLAG